MSNYWSDLVKGLEPYTPGEQPKDGRFIKLNTNENPYPPSPRVIEALKEAACKTLRLYPDPECEVFRAAVADYLGLDMKQIFAGNGSDEILAFAFAAFFNPGRAIVFPAITYSFFPVYACLYGLDYRTVPLADDFTVPGEAFWGGEGGVVLSNPNPPAGTCMPPEIVRDIVAHNPDRVVIIDEAYIDFGGDTCIGLINRYPNLLVVRTLSKSRSLAGLRIAFAAGHPHLIEALARVKNSFNSYTLDRLALAGGAEAMRDTGYFEETRTKIISTRERIAAELRTKGFKVADSRANFLFAGLPGVSGYEIYSRLREMGILVRYFAKPVLDGFIRVSIGTDGDMDRFIDSIQYDGIKSGIII